MIDLITGHQGIPHISAEQISTLHRSLMGTNGDNKVVRMKDGGVTSVGLTVSIDTGYWRVHGYDMQIQEAEAVIFDPTEAGYQRIDDLFVEILQDISSGVQRSELVIVQGEPSAIIATAPAPPTEAASEYDLLVECVPVCSVLVIEGAMTMTDLTIPFKASSGDSESFAPEFDPALSYNIGDVVEHEGTLYKFIANHTGAWDDADVEETTVAALIAGKADIPVPINQGGTEATTADQARGHLGAASNTEFHYAYNMIRNSSSDAYSTTKSYKAGDYCIHGNLLYKCTSACTPGSWEVNRSHFAIDTIANALTSVNNELNKHTPGTIVDLLSYNAQNPFVAPSDGYVYVNSSTGTGNLVVSATINGISDISVYPSGAYQGNQTFIRKGSTVAPRLKPTGCMIGFYPLE